VSAGEGGTTQREATVATYPAMTDEDIQSALRLLDPSEPTPSGPGPDAGVSMSCVAAAVREARALVGRDPYTGESPPDNGNTLTWAGAHVWFVFFEQVGSIFQRAEPPDGVLNESVATKRALRCFSEVSGGDIEVLVDLRNRLAHDWSLTPPSKTMQPYYHFRLDDGPDLVHSNGDERRVSLVQLAELGDEVLANLWEKIADGKVVVVHPGGIEGALQRFTMRFNP
jgi:hypothetical protein